MNDEATRTETTTRIFLSYARGDDEPFVKRLHADLTSAGFKVWFDRESLMSRGLTFHQEIKDVIRTEVDRVIYVGGPKAAMSAYVREEWQFALECDQVIVTPILRLGDYEHVPGELSLLHCEDFRDDANYPTALAKLITSLRQPNPKLGALFAVPNLPPNFLGRPELMRRVRDALLVDLQKPQVITGADARVGMQGMGGIGKSVLAAALARNRQVRQVYPDGVVWIAAGQKLTDDDLLKRQRDLARHLGGDDTFASLAQGQGVLGQLLAAKAVLLVLDDVWRAADAQAFDVLGPRCRMLVTTRDKGILDALHGELVPVSLFTEPEALQLLADAVNVAPATLPTEAREVARECGLLPLALALCGGMARKRGGDFHSVLERLRRADLEKIADRESLNEQHRSIWKAMKVSVDALTSNEQRRFIELSVFPHDETIPEAAVCTLWSHTGGLDEFGCESLLISLSERSLIRLDTETPQAGQSPHRRVSLHDLLCDFATGLAGDPVPLHCQLLDAYRKLCPNGWSSGPNDGYFFHHIATHLARGNSWHELKSLVEGGGLHLLRRWTETGEYQQGIECLRGLIDATKATDRRFAAGLATQLARIYSRLDRFDDAETWLLKALKWCPWWRSRRTRAVAYHELASLSLYRGAMDESERLYRRALRLCRTWLPTIRDEASANLVALASLMLDRFRYPQAEELANEALNEARRSGDVAHTIAAHRLLANVAKNRADFRKAKELLQAGMILAKTADYPFEKVAINLLDGWVSFQQAALANEPTTDALELFETALKEAARLHHLPYTVGALFGLAQVHFLTRDVEGARPCVSEAERHLANTPRRQDMFVWLALQQASLALLDGELEAAAARFRNVIQRAHELRLHSIEADGWVGLGASHFHQQRKTEAEDCWNKAEAAGRHASPLRHQLVLKAIACNKAGEFRVPL